MTLQHPDTPKNTNRRQLTYAISKADEALGQKKLGKAKKGKLETIRVQMQAALAAGGERSCGQSLVRGLTCIMVGCVSR